MFAKLHQGIMQALQLRFRSIIIIENFYIVINYLSQYLTLNISHYSSKEPPAREQPA